MLGSETLEPCGSHFPIYIEDQCIFHLHVLNVDEGIIIKTEKANTGFFIDGNKKIKTVTLC